MNKAILALAILAAVVCGGAASAASAQNFDLTLGAAPPQRQTEYKIAPSDRITIKVFGQPSLSSEKVQVDASGNIDMPLVGTVVAAGHTPKSLAGLIEARLGEKYLQDPSVSVLIDEAVGENVTVTGAVTESGVYALKGPTTLVQAIALAKGPDARYADLKRVAVIRVMDGQRARAVFNVDAIRSGKAEDPYVMPGDTVIVADSGSKRIWRELVGSLPALGTFTLF